MPAHASANRLLESPFADSPVRRLKCALPACLLALSLAVALPATVLAAPGTFYVDGSGAPCSPSGGTSALPFCTIASAMQALQSVEGGGSFVYVHPAIYRERVLVSRSGGENDLDLVIQATGPGAVIEGADDFSNPALWWNLTGNIWGASVPVEPNQVFVEGARLEHWTGDLLSMPPMSFQYVAAPALLVTGGGRDASAEGVPGAMLFVNVGGPNPGLGNILVSQRDNGFRFSAKTRVVVEGFEVIHTNEVGIFVKDVSTRITLRNNLVRYAGTFGIEASGGSGHVIEGNQVSFSNDHGINLIAGVTQSLVKDNQSLQNARPAERAANGISLFGCPGNRIEGNLLHDNQDTGLQLNGGSNDNLCLQNRSWSNGDHGFDHLSSSTGNVHIGDVAWGNYMDGFSVEGGATGTHFYNCISVDNGIGTLGANLLVDATSAAGLASDYNIFWNSSPATNRIEYGGTIFSSLAAYAAASGQDSHSLEADPRFVSPGAGDFHLQAGSPAIDSGTSDPTEWPATDAEGQARADDPNTPNSGAGPIAFADRGALEFVPPPGPPQGKLVCGTSFEDGIDGWNPYHSSLQRIAATVVHDGDFVLQVDGSQTASDFGVNDSPNCVLSSPAAGTHYRYSVWVRSQTGNGPVQLKVREYLNDVRQGGSTESDEVPLGPDWTQVTVERVTLVAGSELDLKILDRTGGEVFEVDDISVRIVGEPGNDPPTAALTILPAATGTTPFAITADASGSTDDGTIISYAFDFGDGIALPPQSASIATHTYLIPGDYACMVTVTDNGGLTASRTVNVHVEPDGGGDGNLCGNPSFETSLDGWHPSSGSSLVQGSPGHESLHCLEIHGPASTTQFYVNDSPNWVEITPAAGAHYRFTAWLRSPSGSGAEARLRIREYYHGVNQGTRVYSSPAFLDANWTQLTVDYRTLTLGSTLDCNVVIDPLVPSDVVQVDDVGIFLVPEVGPEARTPTAIVGPLRFAAAAAPNPIGTKGALEFAITRPGPVSVQVFDASGRRVMSLLNGAFMPAGRHRLSLGEARARLSAGLYFFRLEAPEGSLRGRFVVMR